jgi:hypothetical protein
MYILTILYSSKVYVYVQEIKFTSKVVKTNVIGPMSRLSNYLHDFKLNHIILTSIKICQNNF